MSPRPVTALVPVKARHLCKTRLAEHLSPQQRLALVRSMLSHVLDVLQQSPAIGRIVVLSPEQDQLPDDLERFADAGFDLNSSLQAALQRLRQEGEERVLILPADLACVQPDDIARLADAAHSGDVAIAPSADGGGTNALLLPLDHAWSLRFGHDSFQAHLQMLQQAERSYRMVISSGLGFDVDSDGDLMQLQQSSASAVSVPLSDAELTAELLQRPLPQLLAEAEALTLQHFGTQVTYSRKVFIPLTQLCRDVCHYCTFAKAPKNLRAPYLSLEEVVAIAREGKAAGCTEALFTLGDQPEDRYRSAREALQAMGYTSTLDYLHAAAKAVYDETGLLPHLNPGLMKREEMARLRDVSASMGIMLESTAQHLCDKGGPHYGSPDKEPQARLQTLRTAGELRVPFTTGLLIGIGESRTERIEALLAIRDLHRQYGHIQEVIIQNFRAKPDIRMAEHPEPDLDEHLWTIAVARLIFGGDITVQAPPNLQPGVLQELIRAGVNDWGGVSPVTPDHVNPERPWPHLEKLAQETAAAGRQLCARLPLGPQYALNGERWLSKDIEPGVLRHSDASGLAREETWYAGAGDPVPTMAGNWLQTSLFAVPRHRRLAQSLDRARQGIELSERDITDLFAARGNALQVVLHEADQLRRELVGDTVTYVVNRNINYTNICGYRCQFCAFAKGQGESARLLRGPAYRLDLDEIGARTEQAWQRGATEVCLQGGIHPHFTGQTYLDIVQAVKSAVPEMHVHAFSPLEVWHGAETLGLSLADFLCQLREAGLSTLPGTAAEILHDDVRRIICADKLSTEQWLQVLRTAHRQGLKTTTTIMFGHVEQPRHWAAHLLHLRRLQQETGGITEFVPLPYVHMEAPMARRGESRSGPTFREAVLMHAVGRLVLNPLIKNVQTSWVKMGAEGAAFCLQAGANDLGGTLMDESITRAAGGVNGQEFSRADVLRVAHAIARPCQQRNTLYGTPVSRGSEQQPALIAVAD